MKLKDVFSERYLEKFADAINKEYLKTDIGVTTQEVKDTMNEPLMNHGILISDTNNWIDLDVDNLPERFFTRDDIELECLVNERTKYYTEVLFKKSERYFIIKESVSGAKYRYRIQENKEPMRITEDMALDVCTKLAEEAKYKSADFYHIKDIENHYGRKVIIID